MSNKEVYVTDKAFCKVNMETGEMSSLRVKMNLHSASEFFIAYLGAWKDFKPSEGMKMKVFIHCILSSVLSNPSDSDSDGNIFKVQSVIRSVQREMSDVSSTAIRMNILRLHHDGFIIKSSVRGEYYINPKYGVKGAITERTFLELNLRASAHPSKDSDSGVGES